MKLGNAVENIAHSMGADKILSWATNGADCHCSERKETLNKIQILARHRKINCMTEGNYLRYGELKLKLETDRALNNLDSIAFKRIYRETFNSPDANICGHCGGGKKKIKQWIKELNSVYETY